MPNVLCLASYNAVVIALPVSDYHTYFAVSACSPLVHCFGLLQPLIYNDFSYAGLDSLSVLLHAGIACLVLHLDAGIAWVAFLACEWLFLIGL